MKRRSFCRYAVLGSASVAAIVSKDFSMAITPQSSQSKSRHRWVVLYWMPYDNNLVIFGEAIITMLVKGTKNSEALVAVQSDYFGDPKMRLRILTNGTIQEMNVTGEDSSDISAFSEYLNWAHQTFEAEHWAIIIVGHGGKINEVSPDEHSFSSQATTWMRVDQFTNSVSRFNQAVGGRVEFLFFQNCNKATLEVIYESRNCARYTLASQLTLGAPNYYYKRFLEQLNEPSINGREAAIAIMESERADMYHTLTLVNNQAVEQIPDKLSRVIQQLLGNDLRSINLSDISTYRYFDEQQCDVLALLEYLSKSINKTQNELTEFADFLKSSVITYYKTGGNLYGSDGFRNTDSEKLCGLSLYLPETEQAIDRYNLLALSQRVDLLGLYRTILNNVT